VKKTSLVLRTLTRLKRALACSSLFCRVMSLMTCAGTRRKLLRRSDLLAMRHTDIWLMLSSAEICRVLRCVLLLPSCEQINSLTSWAFSLVMTVADCLADAERLSQCGQLNSKVSWQRSISILCRGNWKWCLQHQILVHEASECAVCHCKTAFP